jgi:type I restriction enzyme S subunit
MNEYPLRKLGYFLSQCQQSVQIDPTCKYSTAGILNRGRGLFRRPVILGSETKYSKYNRLGANQLVYSKLFAWEGAITVVPEEFDGLFVSHEFPTFRIDPERADVRYVRHLATWPSLHASLGTRTSGVGSRRQRVNVDQLLSCEVPLPDVEEQRRVATRLDELVSRVDSIHVLRERIEYIRASLAESLIASAVASVRGSVRIGEILTFQRTSVQIDEADTYRTIGIRSFGRGIIRHPAVSPDGLSKLSYFTFPEGALALSNLMAWEGGISVTQAEDVGHIASNRFFFYLPVDDRVNTSYLRHFLLSKQGLALVGSACSAGAERNRTLGRKRFEALTIPLPSRAVQDQIASTLDRLSERLNSAYAEPSLASLRPSILNAAFTGQL